MTITKKKHEPSEPGGKPLVYALGAGLLKLLKGSKIRLGPAMATAAAFLISLLIITGNPRGSGELGNIEEFEAGRVAERDIIAEHTVSYEDTNATRLRFEAQRKLIPAVFRYAQGIDEEMRKNYANFIHFSASLMEEDLSADAYSLKMQAQFPGIFPGEALAGLFQSQDREKFPDFSSSVLNYFWETGVFALPKTGLENYNPDAVELLHNGPDSRIERERINYGNIITLDTLEEHFNQHIAEGSYPASLEPVAWDLLKPFIKENVFFSPGDTEQRVAELKSQIEPVVKYIEQGKRVIKKGFIITDEEMAQLRVLELSLSGRDPRAVAGLVLVLFLVYALLIFLGSKPIVGRLLNDAEIYLLSGLSALYIILAVFVRNLFLNTPYLPVSVVLPTALVVMLPSILISPRLALAMGLVLPLGAFFAGALDTFAYFFALVSGVVASYTLRGAEKRMDLVKAGLIIAAANCIALIAVLLLKQSNLRDYPVALFWAAFNGVASGMMVLGILPLMEHALNAATTFRLIELSDLNSPLLKRLFTVAPGTYGHSIMVANLAEAACQEIGANPLLARVGAYYHDIGKMDQPDYFVENQTVYNKHNDIAPRLSATVIRSHVKLGLEKARCMGLPREVTDIIAEHHGNSLITWFYNEALKRETQVNKEDFTYPGTPPRSRESAVVMLADVSEAAVRTLKKPNASKIEKFIQSLFDAKVEHGQLAESELTFRDLETIKKAFVRVLAGHYHSRIEYPKLPKEISTPEGKKSAEEVLP
ncbi:MAG: HDIG domain-containing protein [Treponema sp.]|jgi:putative nucleotidyltransferase with HDIG domain|nr:HDIG domain-containing protein [Treponema sp.]